ncbi:vWA domain-containing protein [Aurantimonas sp. HBX-1]|uniref:vWA domain-containing protein n=1 Tax=Aurantimonas sp. HBX-1 TaxID=2906072 RepID=UPI001F2F4420|nr:VWA domain-containing protein [Aurantimonas sp. HBX-1]UIJ73297.1 VWA domain-containing protein [Aurantimonas sp. HBX-1]
MTKLTALRAAWHDRRGNVAVIFGLTLPVLACCMAAAVDLNSVYGSERNLQQAADTAALAAAKEYGQSQDAAYLSRIANAYFFHNAGEDTRAYTQFQYDGVTVVDGETVLKVTATRQQPTWFGDLLALVTNERVDWRQFPLSATSEIVVQNRSIEMALVLDNSGSMAWSVGGARKIDTLKDAAKDLAASLMKINETAPGKPPVMIGVVPFSGSVNVGKDNIDAPWMDRYGDSPIHHENLDWGNWKEGNTNLAEQVGNRWRRKSDGTWLTRQWLWENASVMGSTKMEWQKRCGKYSCEWVQVEVVTPSSKRFPAGWEGCIEARPLGLAATDAAPVPGTNTNVSTHGETLFVPLFAPDEPEEPSDENSYLTDSENIDPTKSTTRYFESQSDIHKYFSTKPNRKTEQTNLACDTAPITPLSAQQSVVDAALDEMQPHNLTNIPQGLIWGWHVVSPGEPFTQGRAKDAKDNLKVIVVMTDGENTYSSSSNSNRSEYGAFGYGQVRNGNGTKVGRIFDATTTTTKAANETRYVQAMNETLAKICVNAKNDGRHPDGTDGILIFTIAFDVKDGSSVKKLLEDCASYGIADPTAKLYYDAQSKEQLAAAFGSITEEISSLRIAR